MMKIKHIIRFRRKKLQNIEYTEEDTLDEYNNQSLIINLYKI